MNLAELLFDPTADVDEPLVHANGRDATRGEVQARALQVLEALADADVAPGEPVGVMLSSGIETISALFGVWKAGAVYVPLNPRLSDDEISHVSATVRPAAVITDPEHGGRFVDVAIITSAASGSTEEPLPVVTGPARSGDPYDPGVALVQFTSGTTGRPKPVLLAHAGVLDLLDGVLRKLRSSSTQATASADAPAKPRLANLVPVSLSLWAGIYNVLFALRVDALVVVMDRFTTAEFAELVSRFTIKSTVLPPAAMAMLSDDEAITDLSPLRFVRSITAPLSPSQARRFHERFGVGVLNSYGQTEIGGEIIGWNAEDFRAHGDAKLGAVGRPHDGVELRIVDDEGHEVEPDTAGELWVRTPALSAGYADGGDLSDRLSPDGFFRTGDFARVDPEGFVWLSGRVSDMINRGGLKVHPGDVEEVLRLSPGIADVAVVGVPDDRLGEVPWAFVVPRGQLPSPAELEALCRAHLAPYKVPVHFEPVDELPRNEVGKVLTRELVTRATSS